MNLEIKNKLEDKSINFTSLEGIFYQSYIIYTLEKDRYSNTLSPFFFSLSIILLFSFSLMIFFSFLSLDD